MESEREMILEWELTYRRADGHTSINWASTPADVLTNNRIMRSMGHTPIRARVVETPLVIIRRENGNPRLLR